MSKFASVWFKRVLVVLGVILVLGVGLVSFYKSSILVSDFGEFLRKPLDLFGRSMNGLFRPDEVWYPSRVMVNDKPALVGQEKWPYHFYVKVLKVDHPYYGKEDQGSIRAINEWFLKTETFSGKEVMIHVLAARVVEGVDHPVFEDQKTFVTLSDKVESQFIEGDVIQVFINKTTFKDAVIYPLAVFKRD